jgi:aspartyl-tRNA(Asn)/glutamyl-tRNA(Gln) amidotransferase subunit A
MARSARDCALLLAALTGRTPAPPCDDLAGTSLAIEREHHARAEGVDPGAAAAFEAGVAVLEALGAAATEVSLPHNDAVVAASQVVMLREAFELHRSNLHRRWRDYGVHTRERLAHGAFLTAGDEARARDVHRRAACAVDELLERHDAIVCLTAGGPPERVDEFGVEHHLAVAGLTFTRIWNALGHPAVSVPVGFTSKGLPVGMQMIGRRGGDEPLLALAETFQNATSWHVATPPVAAVATSRGPPHRLDTPG